MEHVRVIHELKRNRDVFQGLLAGLSREEYLWKPEPGKWCILEILCHLIDEEREDFRSRTRHILESRSGSFLPIDPVGWVVERKYISQDYDHKKEEFLSERLKSVEWLESLLAPGWQNSYKHPKFGAMTAEMFLYNWLAHDYIHIRQILKLKYSYFEQLTDEPLTYAGNW